MTTMANHPLLEVLEMALPPREARVLKAWLHTFYSFQLRWLLETARFAICNKSRQIGFSHTTAAWAVLRSAFLGETTTIISKGERESMEVLEAAKKHADVLVALGSRWADATLKGEELRFASGGRIVALPASSGGRSFSGNVVLDEMAYHEGKADAVWDSASAVTLHDGCMRIISTPNGVGNLFHHLWTDETAHKGYALHSTTIDEAIAAGMNVDLEACWQMAHGDPRLFDQLFRCKFLDGSEQYIPTEWILRAAVQDLAELRVYEPVFYGGLDIGLVNDLSSLATLAVDPQTNHCALQPINWSEPVGTLCFKRTDWDEQQGEIERAWSRYQWRRLCVDQTGLGRVPAQLLQAKFGRGRVEPIDFGVKTKEELATALFQAFADQMISIPNDPDLIHDLCALKRIVTSTGSVRYDADRTERGHADRAWALALALLARSTLPDHHRTKPLHSP
jgi:phage FluMu gp28-like protein